MTMKIHVEVIKRDSNIWRENSNFIRFMVNFHFHTLGFGAKIEIGEKVRISGTLCTVVTY